MPKPTFENLPAEKRARIIEIALAEFAEHPYELASISRIVEQAGIAKGSLYQYFAHKQDLYLYLVEYAARAQLAILAGLTPPDPGLGFFALVRWQMSASVRVGAAAPQLVQLMHRANSDDLPFRDEVRRRLGSLGEGHFLELLRLGVERGEIDPGLDLELAAFTLKSLMGELGGLIARRLDVSVSSAAHAVERLAGPEAEQIYDAVLDMLRHGLTPRAGRRGPEERYR